MNIRLNGEAFQLEESTSIAELVKELQLEGKRFAIEVNDEIIPRGEHATTLLNDEDKVEVVQAIGGG